MYTDGAITGTNTKKRTDFLRLIEDCMAGKIDYVITKSVSRFARNTLDTLNYTRKLKEKNIPVFFEKENIISTDNKGELILTIMASIAQEEARSTSENVKMGIQFRFQKGEVHVNYSRFLGYTKEKKTNKNKNEYRKLLIVPEEAEIVRRIFREYLLGASLQSICDGLEADGILTGAGKKRWRPETVKKMLQNEKYMGDALLQKTYTEDFLAKKRAVNNGVVPQYYVEKSHDAIISKEIFMQVQEEIVRRANLRIGKNGKKRMYSSKYALSGNVLCGECNNIYRRLTWLNRGKKVFVWRCLSKQDKGQECGSSSIHEAVLHECVVSAINQMIIAQDTFVEIFMNNISTVLGAEFDMSTEDIDTRLAQLQNELIQQVDSREDFDDVTEEIHRLWKVKEELMANNAERRTKRQRILEMTTFLQEQSVELTDYDDGLVRKLVDTVVIHKDKLTVTFKSGIDIDVEL